MRIKSVKDNKIRIEIPLTTQSGKIRVKIRNSFYEYGIPTATKQIPFSQKHYIEWQIGYDVDKSNKEKLVLSTLQETHFVGANGKNKALYELSEYLYYFVQWGIIRKEELVSLTRTIELVQNFIDEKYSITTISTQKYFDCIEHYVISSRLIQYPYLIFQHPPHFKRFSVEVIIKEKQRAIGVQPMLYVCFPITELESKDDTTFLGRVANTKECGILSLDARHKTFVLECFKIFGILSKSHHYDVLQILHLIKKTLLK